MKCMLMIGAVAMALATSSCVVETGPDSGYSGGNCLPTLYIDYEIQNASGAPVTCAGAGAASVQATVDGVMFPQSCFPADSSFGRIAVPLQGLGTYNAIVNVFDSKGNALAPAQSTSFNITSCGDTETQTPAILVVTPPGAPPTTTGT
jgi:hypothetical protein